MDVERQRRIIELLGSAVEVPTEDRREWLERHCGDHRSLIDELLTMLSDGRELSRFLEPLDPGPTLAAVPPADDGSPRGLQVLGPYRLLKVLGEGGMGIVYLAEQTEPVERRLALKLIRASLASPRVAARFTAERQAMARLSHPNIAQMYEAGTTREAEGGEPIPYFAMELVEGEPITGFADAALLPLEQRLRLFATVCRGVHHAHRQGILHRDLKPSNILVAETDGQPVPKIIDFGIAKAIDRPLIDGPSLTAGGFVGTPAYMSPESLQPADDRDVDTRTDVYALGVLLFELLTGTRPFEDRGMNAARVLRRIVTQDPPRVSARFAALAPEEAAAAASHRRLSPAALRRQLTGDLDYIVAKAIARDPEQRYDSGAELAGDVERHLRIEPVLAVPSRALYRLRKLARRHRMAAATAVVMVLALVVGVLGLSIGLVHARRAEAEARSQAASAREVADFLVGVFELSDPLDSPDDVSARDLLARGIERIDQELAGQPLVRARMLGTMGRVQSRLGLEASATRLLEEALAIQRVELGEDHLDVADSLQHLAVLYGELGRPDDARAAVETALALRQELLGADDPSLVGTLTAATNVHIQHGDLAAAEELIDRALNLAERVHGEDSLEVARILHNKAAVRGYQGRFQDAAGLFQRSLAIREQVLGGDHPSVARSLNGMALAAANLGEEAWAEQLLRRSIEILERTLGPEHSDLRSSLGNLGYRYFRQGRNEEARGLLERAVAIDQARAVESAGAAARITNLGLVYWRLGRLAEAEPLFHRATAIRERVLAPDHPHRATSLWGLANVYRDQGRFDEAESLYLRALEIRERTLAPDHPELEDARREYAVLLRLTGREAEAAALTAQPPA